MNHTLINSLLLSLLLISDASSKETIQQRVNSMTKEVTSLKKEVSSLKSENAELTSVVDSDDGTHDPYSVETLDIINDLRRQIADMNQSIAKNRLNFGVDFRTSVDNLHYEMANGSKPKNDALMSNRLWLNMGYSPSENLHFGGQLAYNKLFGERSMINAQNTGMDSFDWVSSENRQDDTLRVQSAYINYEEDQLFGLNVPWSLGVGRRPSTNGKLISYREDDEATSPLGHISNAEFDGGNLKFNLANVTGISGASVKFAAGQGMSNAEPRFSATPYADSSSTDTGNIMMYAINIVPYHDQNVETEFQYTYANNLIDITNGGFDQFGAFNPANYDPSLESVGSLHLASAFVALHGIGEGWSDYLDKTTLFLSGAMSKTDPDTGKAMLGSTESETGYSYWIGTQMPSLFSEKGRWGVEFNHGSQYWRSFTYGEDTAIGSKIATRGDAYELYFTEPLTKGLSFQLRYTYIDYDYSGSNGFFGSQSGTPMKISDIPSTTDLAGVVVDKAQDIRAYIRYKF